jgi:hypothetical protein
MQTIDITPTWEGILPALLAVIENGNFEGKKIALEEITRMAQLADLYVEHNAEIERLTKLENSVRSLYGVIPCKMNEDWKESAKQFVSF